MNIIELFLDAAKKYPQKIAIIEGSKSICYNELEREVIATAAYFKQMNINSADRVLVFVPMGIDLYRTVLAIFYLGATAVFLDEWVSKSRLELCCRIADCKAFIAIKKAAFFLSFSKEIRKIPIKLKLKKINIAEQLEVKEVDEAAAALITFTTGSTGTPKAAKRSHQFLKFQFAALREEIQAHENDIDMPVLPIILFLNLGVGCTSVIADFKMTNPDSIKEETIYNQLFYHKVNRITASPFLINRLSSFMIKNNLKLTQIEKIFTGGAAVFPREAHQYDIAFPKSENTIVYGSTEAEPISSIKSKELYSKAENCTDGLAVGNVFTKMNIKIIKIINEPISVKNCDDFKKLCLADEEVGEIIVSGDHVLKEYFDNEAAFLRNKIVVENQIWHRTGDSGFLKGQKLYLTGRCEQLIYKSATFISPFIIENRLQSIDGISLGTMIDLKNKLLLIIESELSEEQISKRTGAFSYDKLIVVRKIPRDPRHNSKIDYNALKEHIKKLTD